MLGSSEMRRQLLRSSALFSHLGDREADAILAEARVVSYAEGEHIFAKGDPGNSMMAVLKGRVVISNPSLDGRQLVVTIFRESDVFGEIALLDGKERSADASAATDCELLVVPRRSLLRLFCVSGCGAPMSKSRISPSSISKRASPKRCSAWRERKKVRHRARVSG
jgi:CRP-like cAMP-binding protein